MAMKHRASLADIAWEADGAGMSELAEASSDASSPILIEEAGASPLATLSIFADDEASAIPLKGSISPNRAIRQ